MLTFLCISVASYVLVCVVAYAAQRSLVFFPGPPPRATPKDARLDYDEVSLETSDGERLHAWYIRPEGTRDAPPRGAVLVCHGNAGTIGDRLHLARAFADMRLAVLLFDYRGYGKSSGTPSERGLYLDADSAYRELTSARGFAPERIVAYGESLGGAVAIELALRERVAALIVESSFTSLADVGAKHYAWLPVRWITRYRFDSIGKIARVAPPKLFAHSRADEIIPFEQGLALFEEAREPKEFLETSGLHGVGGFSTSAHDAALVRAFIDRVL